MPKPGQVLYPVIMTEQPWHKECHFLTRNKGNPEKIEKNLLDVNWHNKFAAVTNVQVLLPQELGSINCPRQLVSCGP